MELLIGADPEVFMKKDGKPVSAHGAIPGTKKEPHKVECGAVQVDGMALEFNIDPAASVEEFVGNCQTVLGILEKMVDGHELAADPVAYFGFDYIDAQPEEAKILGCEPDFGAWNGGKANQAPDVKTPFRTGAGHIHIGFGKDHDVGAAYYIDACCDAVKELDFYLALPSLVFDTDVDRRKLYGAAGAFRPKSYGFEYRTLSNKWLSDVSLMKWVYNNAKLCMEKFFAGERLADKYGDIQAIVNNSDVEAAKAIIKDAGIPMPA